MKLPDDFYFTQSNLQDYVDCAYRFYLRHLLRVKWPALLVDDAVTFEERGQIGARFHRLIQQYLMGVDPVRLSDMAAADSSPDISVWWEDFLIHVPPRLVGTRWVETTLSTVVAGYPLLAKYDLILVQPQDDLLIFDWKTSQKRIRKEWLLNRMQTRLYRLILVQSGSILTSGRPANPEKIKMHYWFSNHPEATIELAYNSEAYDEDKTYISGLIDEVLQRNEKDFLRTEDLQKCRYCVYRSFCDRGTQAGDLDTYETFDAEPGDINLDLDFEDIAEIKF